MTFYPEIEPNSYPNLLERIGTLLASFNSVFISEVSSKCIETYDKNVHLSLSNWKCFSSQIGHYCNDRRYSLHTIYRITQITLTGTRTWLERVLWRLFILNHQPTLVDSQLNSFYGWLYVVGPLSLCYKSSLIVIQKECFLYIFEMIHVQNFNSRIQKTRSFSDTYQSKLWNTKELVHWKVRSNKYCASCSNSSQFSYWTKDKCFS